MSARPGRLTAPAALATILALVFTLLPVLAQMPGKGSGMSDGNPVVPGDVATSPGVQEHTIARIWNEELLDAIRIDLPKPPVHARNLFHLSVAMYDAWATYDSEAFGYVFTEKNTAVDVAAARHEAISYAAFRLLMHRFPGIGFDNEGNPCQPGAEVSQARFEQLMLDLGYDPSNTDAVGDAPSAIGNRIGQAIIDYGLSDGAVEGFDLCYPDPTGYVPLNDELIFDLFGTNESVVDPNHWQQLAFEFLVTQNDIPIGKSLQSFVGIAWGGVAGFALTDADIPPPPAALPCVPNPAAPQPHFDPGCAPQLGGVGDEMVKDSVVELIRYSSFVDPTDGEMLDHSPGVYGNNPLGTDDGTGHPVNPHTGLPYDPNPMKRADFARVSAEFWADGPDSETPPGHWNTLANYVTDHPMLGEKRLGGTGPLLDALEWDVKLLLAVNGSTHDAAIVAWGAKHFYDSSRPITLIRYMSEMGQSTDENLPSYSPIGIPLVDGLIELITEQTAGPGGKHEHLAAFCGAGNAAQDRPCSVDADCVDELGTPGMCQSSVGQIAIRAWLGKPEDPETQIGGVGWRLGSSWMPYQADNFVTPPFPGYISGHSTFSRAAAEVLACFTGDEFFPGGLGEFVAYQNEYLRFENGPTETVRLQWATYADAADEAGASRRYGGIHPYYDDFPARNVAVGIGQAACARAFELFHQVIPPDDDEDEDEDGDGDEDSDGDEGSDDDSDSDDDEDGDGTAGPGGGSGKPGSVALPQEGRTKRKLAPGGRTGRKSESMTKKLGVD